MQERAASWHERTGAAWVLRALIVVVPIGASIATGIFVSRHLPRPYGIAAHLAWVLGVLACSGVVFLAVERVARRFLPLAMLLRLSLIFPDQAPSRFAVALRAWNPRRLDAWAQEQARHGSPDAGRQAEIVLTMVTALAAHDRKTRGHSERVQALTDLMARELRLSDADAQRLRWAALLHDIGKLSVPAEILNSPGRLDDAAMQVIRTHPSEGARITEPLASWLGEWRHGIDQHHERYDGAGYPIGLAGHEISLAGRIVSVTDAFETMTAVRSYKKAMSVSAARAELVRGSGTHFDPEMVRSFLALSIGRLGWTTGAVAGLAQLPVIGILPRTAAALLAVGAVTAVNPVHHAPTASTPASEATTPHTAPAPADGSTTPVTNPTPTPAATAPAGAVPGANLPGLQILNQTLTQLGVQVPDLPPVPAPLSR